MSFQAILSYLNYLRIELLSDNALLCFKATTWKLNSNIQFSNQSQLNSNSNSIEKNVLNPISPSFYQIARSLTQHQS